MWLNRVAANVRRYSDSDFWLRVCVFAVTGKTRFLALLGMTNLILSCARNDKFCFCIVLGMTSLFWGDAGCVG